MSSIPPIRWTTQIKRETTTSALSTVRPSCYSLPPRAPAPLAGYLRVPPADRRLRVLARLRGKEPTPEPEMQQGSSSGGQGDAGTGRLQHVQSWR